MKCVHELCWMTGSRVRWEGSAVRNRRYSGSEKVHRNQYQVGSRSKPGIKRKQGNSTLQWSVKNRRLTLSKWRQATLKTKVKTPKERISFCLCFLLHQNQWLHSNPASTARALSARSWHHQGDITLFLFIIALFEGDWTEPNYIPWDQGIRESPQCYSCWKTTTQLINSCEIKTLIWNHSRWLNTRTRR